MFWQYLVLTGWSILLGLKQELVEVLRIELHHNVDSRSSQLEPGLKTFCHNTRGY